MLNFLTCLSLTLPYLSYPIWIHIKESIYIRVNNPTLNQIIGQYNLSHIWDRVLFNTPGFQLGSSQQPSAQTLFRSMSHPNINGSNSHAHKHNLGLMLIYPIIDVYNSPKSQLGML